MVVIPEYVKSINVSMELIRRCISKTKDDNVVMQWTFHLMQLTHLRNDMLLTLYPHSFN